MTLSDHKRAAENLDFAGMLVSIILAVIAIVYTFVSAEGQKETISKLENAVRELDGSVKETRKNLSMLGDVSQNIGELHALLIDMIKTNDIWQRKLDERIERAASIDEIKEYIKAEKPQVTASVDNSQQGPQERALIRRAMHMIKANPDVSDDELEQSLRKYLNSKGGLYTVSTLFNPLYFDNIVDQARMQLES